MPGAVLGSGETEMAQRGSLPLTSLQSSREKVAKKIKLLQVLEEKGAEGSKVCNGRRTGKPSWK